MKRSYKRPKVGEIWTSKKHKDNIKISEVKEDRIYYNPPNSPYVVYISYIEEFSDRYYLNTKLTELEIIKDIIK